MASKTVKLNLVMFCIPFDVETDHLPFFSANHFARYLRIER